MSNETKRDVFVDAVDALADAQASGGNVGHQDANLFMAEYENALPDDLPVITELISKYLIMRKRDRGDLVQALDEGTSFLLDGTQWESVQDWFWFSDVKDRVDTFARAWVLGVWRVEETGEIVKLEAEK
ncbi:hypothetical protein [Lacticaseibacillus paracasei]|uniref:Phage protein n=1 Tax=Lacticaseibacillus paracasei TaxID=1597 RepID=A0ABD5CYM4_LACPA|nr:hypothetical protein [Lacticaseibacillus paracasei]MDR7624988.1 hypothetical protein [Lacticaseibacillus paracasei]QPC13394.1 hypothetical protein LacP0245_00030 [Lacticaseibacillus paracasei subsp. tolerans]QUS98676.1 hypothetical protein KFU60_00030 [Lacticaseibacillus paracasei subsp. tolerans]WMX60502.1 hypothetical protein RF667_00915 [Lacticaseibacillus paracasei]